jgi:hypothetical protein
VGATFLKNVYSIYRYEPSAIGFAALSGQSNTVTEGTSDPTTGGGTVGPNGGSGTSDSGAGRTAIGVAGIALAVAGSMVVGLF